MDNPKTCDETRLLLLEVMARCPLDNLPESWLESLRKVLIDPNVRLRSEAVATVRSRNLTAFDEQLEGLSRDLESPASVRIAALESLAPRRGRLPAESFSFLMAHLNTDVDPLLRAAAARALAAGSLGDRQLVQLAERLTNASSLIVPLLTPVFAKSRSPEVGLTLVAALKRAPGADA